MCFQCPHFVCAICTIIIYFTHAHTHTHLITVICWMPRNRRAESKQTFLKGLSACIISNSESRWISAARFPALINVFACVCVCVCVGACILVKFYKCPLINILGQNRTSAPLTAVGFALSTLFIKFI